MLQIRQLRRRVTVFRLFLLLLACILGYHYMFKGRGSSLGGSSSASDLDGEGIAAGKGIGREEEHLNVNSNNADANANANPIAKSYKPPIPVKAPLPPVKDSLKESPTKNSQGQQMDVGQVHKEKEKDKKTDTERSKKVIEAFRHCWRGYKAYAWGFDELHPISHTGSNWFSLGLTLVDALDTAWLLGQDDIFLDARDWVSQLTFDFQEGESNVFEITIRVLGGFLASYHMSGDEVFLKKAVDLGDRLLVAFQTSSHIPLSSINFKEGRAIPAPWGGSSTAEATTLQMEFKTLSHLTKDPKYWNVVQQAMKTVLDQEAPDGLVPIFVNPNTGKFSGGEIRLGSRGDSYYEYLAKQWLLTGQKETRFFNEYRKAIRGVRTRLLGMSHPSQLFFVGETDLGRTFLSPKMDHLVCFLPGTLAWTATKGKAVTKKSRLLLDPESRRDLDLAEELGRSCYEMYAQTAIGLSSEIVFWKTIPSGSYDGPPIPEDLFKYHTSPEAPTTPQDFGTSVPYDDETDLNTRFGSKFAERREEMDFSIHPQDGHNLLRPETVESLFILYRITGKKIYREWGWKIFQAFEKYCKVEGGYTSLSDVRKIPPPQQDKMETFFVGETLKYLYLLLTDRDLVPLDKWIFNTEAHPLPVFDFQGGANPSKEEQAYISKLLVL